MSDNNTTNNFAPGADPNNFVGVDTNGDGIIEQFVYDSNRDGSPEIRISSDTGFAPAQTTYDPGFGSTPAYQPDEGFEHTAHVPSFGATDAAAHTPSFGATDAAAHSPSFGATDAAVYGSDFVATPKVPEPNFGDGSVITTDVNDEQLLDGFDTDPDMPALQYDYKIEELAADINSISNDIGIDLPDDYSAYGIDTLDNGMVDAIAIDLGNDGTIDGIGFDLNEDGLFDVVGVDTDFDGIPDTFLSDIGNNGTVDDVFTIDEF